MKLQIDCREVSRLLSAGLEDALEPSVRARMRLHLAVCEACRNVEEQMAFLRRAMRHMSRGKASEQ
jgi:predicted anti-sigma-YlaC factor YlaD